MSIQQDIIDKKLEMQETVFFQRMLNGQLTKRDYLHFLKNLERLLVLFESRENWFGDTTELIRRKKLTVDILELESEIIDHIHITNAVEQYFMHVRKLSDDKLKEHFYFHYKNLIDNQNLKQPVPNTGRVFDFDNIEKCELFLSTLVKEDWGDETLIVLDFLIKMFKELQLVSDWAASRNNG